MLDTVDAVRQYSAKVRNAFHCRADLLGVCGANQQRGWAVQDGTIVFAQQKAGDAESEIPSMKVIQAALKYASELERIV